ncbi:uncharacterized protein LOC126366454 [Pectinophora gossypiella]|uniref:uncharacterized protein LOC126366454 n=1 Tax=Pectinophora gossypiella TaxID=13191 RepID=UPI00214F2F92|nr:uncharacterized protein LOC126366454 [Pectinophora gossypiella]
MSSNKNQRKDTKNRKTPTEYVSKDILEDDFVKVFWYLLKAQMLLGTCRVDARDRFISAPTKWQKLYTIVLVTTAMTLHFMASIIYLTTRFPYSELQNIAIVTMVITAFAYCNFVIYARFVHNDANIKLYIKMQQIDRLMGIQHNKTINNMLQRINNVTVAITVSIFSTVSVTIFFGGLLMGVAFIASMWTLLTVVMELTLCSNLISYFFARIRFINSILINFVEGKVPMKKPKYLSGRFKEVFRYVAAHTRDYRTSQIDVYLKAVLECFHNYQDLYRYPVAIYFIAFMFYTLASVEFVVYGLKRNVVNQADLTLAPSVLGPALLLILVLIIRIEYFNREIKETKRLSVIVMSLYFEGPLRAKAKRMCRMIEESPPIFSVYDMWHVNAVFLVRFFNVVSTLVVTLLQFAIL